MIVYMGPATTLKGFRLRHKGLHWRSSTIMHKLAKIGQGENYSVGEIIQPTFRQGPGENIYQVFRIGLAAIIYQVFRISPGKIIL